jgi:hypothetical protein
MGNQLSAALTSILICGLAIGCQVSVGEDDDATGGKPSDAEGREGQGGSETATGGTATGGSAATTGGRAATSTGGSATSTGGTGGSGPPDETGPLIEDCDSTAADNNDTRETAMALGTGATLCVGVDDVDWLYVDTPDDGKAHILRVLIAPDPGVDVSFKVEAAADGSSIGNDYTDLGADATLWVTLGPGTRTLLSFGHFTRGGRFTLEASLETESDAYSPNYSKETAAEIAVNEEITAEVHRPYSSATDKPYVDWYQVELATGPHTLSFTQVVSSQMVHASIVDPRGENRANDYAANAGALLDIEFTVKNAGIHYINVGDFRSGPSSFAVGERPAALSEQYVFSVIE